MSRELELEAMDMLKNKWSHLYMFGYPKRPFPTNYENDLNNVMLGLTSKYVEKQKLEFAIEQLKRCTNAPAIRLGIILEELEQKLKHYEKRTHIINGQTK